LSPDRLFELFDEYAAACARGERPEAERYLEQAGSDADELARMIDWFLTATPRPEATTDDVRALEALLAPEPPLVAQRASRGIRVDDVVQALIDRLGLDPAKRAKVKRYYQQLEGGLLDSARVSATVWGVLEDLLGRTPPPIALYDRVFQSTPAPARLYLRTDEDSVVSKELSIDEAFEARAEYDEIDELFTAGP
jgi:hypothetical protein